MRSPTRNRAGMAFVRRHSRQPLSCLEGHDDFSATENTGNRDKPTTRLKVSGREIRPRLRRHFALSR